MKMKLYEIEQAIAECIDEETGEVMDFEKLKELNIAREVKIDNIICLYKEIVYDAEAIDNEIKALTERKRQVKSKSDYLKAWLTEILEGEPFSSPRSRVTWRKSEEVVITDADKLPALLVHEKVTFEPDKKAIKEAIKSGQQIDGAYIAQKNSLNIK